MSSVGYPGVPAFSQIFERPLSGSTRSTVHVCYSMPSGIGHGRFRRALHVAMQIGLYHHPLFTSVWRIVSEDSDSWSSQLAVRGFPRLVDSLAPFEWPFLLIVRTDRIVTAASSDATSTVGYSGFPAYSQILFTELQWSL